MFWVLKKTVSLRRFFWVPTVLKRLIETALLSTHNICFGWGIKKIILCFPLLSGGLNYCISENRTTTPEQTRAAEATSIFFFLFSWITMGIAIDSHILSLNFLYQYIDGWCFFSGWIKIQLNRACSCCHCKCFMYRIFLFSFSSKVKFI